jgi:hypothetical protein
MKLPRLRRSREGPGPGTGPISALWWTVAALIALAAVAFGVTLWLLAIAG